MLLQRLSRRTFCACGWATAVLLSAAIQSNAKDVVSYLITKTHSYKQASASAPVSGSFSDSDIWHAAGMVVATGQYSVYSATIAPAGAGSAEDMTCDYGSVYWNYSRGTTSQALMDAKAPNGTYTITISAQNDGTRSCNLTLSGGAYPSAPWVTNYTAAQSINPISDFSLKWAPFSAGTVNDFIYVRVADLAGTEVFHSPWLGQSSALGGTDRSVTIPAGTLKANQAYGATVYFAKVVNRNTSSYPGVIGFAAFVASTEFQLQTGTAMQVPSITSQPLAQSSAIGGSATFSVTAASAAPMRYQWYHNGSELPGQTNSTLILTNVTPLLEGNYYAVVSNSGGGKTSSMAKLTVIPGGPLPQITVQPVGTRAMKGSAVTLNVSATSSNGPATYQWQKNNIAIEGATNATFKLTKAQTTDCGTFSVRVSNWGGTITSAPVAVTIVSEMVKPTITITNAPAGGRVFSPSLRIGGKASDSSGISIVSWNTGGSYFAPAMGSTNWSAWANLVPGTNVIQVKALDGNGNEAIATKTITYVVTAPITLHTNGLGSIISPGVNLEVGKGYTVKAVPASGYAFLNWTAGAISYTNQSLYFTMQQGGLDLTANFITNLLPKVQGTYNGMFYQSVASAQGAGLFTLILSADGSYTITVTLGTTKYSTTGQFDPTGKSSFSIPRKGLTAITGQLWVDLSGGTDTVHGTLSDQTWTSYASGDRAVYSAKTPAPSAGKYTLAFPPATGAGIMGTGYATVTIDPLGKVAVAGYLADGTAISCGTAVSKAGHWPLFASLPGNGALLGWMAVSNIQPGNNVVTWIKPATTNRFYPQAFTSQTQVTWSTFVTPVNSPVLKYSDAWITWTGGNLPHSITNWITLGNTGTVDMHGATNATMKLNLVNGAIQGTVWHPALNKSVPFNGVILKDVATAGGYFLGTNQSGAFSLSPKAP